MVEMSASNDLLGRTWRSDRRLSTPRGGSQPAGEQVPAVLATALCERGRAGKSSWHHNVMKPTGRKVDICYMSSAKFESTKAPHLIALQTPRQRGEDNAVVGGQPRSICSVVENDGPVARHSKMVNAFGFRFH